MKKSFVLFITLVILAVMVVCLGQTSVLAQKDQVQFTEKILYGDQSVVDGVTVEMKNHYDEHLFWDSTYVIGENPTVSTDYEFYSTRHVDGNYSYSGSMDLSADYFYILDWWEASNGNLTIEGLQLAMQELYEELGPSEEKEKMIYIKDYSEYYSFTVEVHAPYSLENETESLHITLNENELKYAIPIGEKNEFSSELLDEAKRNLEWLEIFQEFFKIPVLENEAAIITMRKYDTGEVAGWGMGTANMGTGTGEVDIPSLSDSEEYDAFSFNIASTISDGDCYFTFDTHTYQGNIVDTSLIPGGFGIYHFPYDEEKQEIYPEQLQMVYALDPNVIIYDMTRDASGKNLLLFTEEDEKIYMSIIDIATMTLTDKIEVSSSEYGIDYHMYDDFMVVDGDKLVVFSIDANGRYSKVFAASKEKIEGLEVDNSGISEIPSSATEYDWNGETLVFASYTYNEEWYSTPCFYVAAVDETGLLYLATYESSLRSTLSYEEDGNYAYQYEHVRPCDEAISIYWR